MKNEKEIKAQDAAIQQNGKSVMDKKIENIKLEIASLIDAINESQDITELEHLPKKCNE